MALGKTHDKINVYVGILCVGSLIKFGISYRSTFFFVAGWFLSTFICSPDLDLGPKKRVLFLKWFLAPYRLFFKHRGKSHHFLLGGLTRIIYLASVIGLILMALDLTGYSHHYTKSYWNFWYGLLFSYDPNIAIYHNLTWVFIGLYLADWTHLLTDGLSSKWKKWKR